MMIITWYSVDWLDWGAQPALFIFQTWLEERRWLCVDLPRKTPGIMITMMMMNRADAGADDCEIKKCIKITNWFELRFPRGGKGGNVNQQWLIGNQTFTFWQKAGMWARKARTAEWVLSGCGLSEENHQKLWCRARCCRSATGKKATKKLQRSRGRTESCQSFIIGTILEKMC